MHPSEWDFGPYRTQLANLLVPSPTCYICLDPGLGYTPNITGNHPPGVGSRLPGSASFDFREFDRRWLRLACDFSERHSIEDIYEAYRVCRCYICASVRVYREVNLPCCKVTKILPVQTSYHAEHSVCGLRHLDWRESLKSTYLGRLPCDLLCGIDNYRAGATASERRGGLIAPDPRSPPLSKQCWVLVRQGMYSKCQFCASSAMVVNPETENATLYCFVHHRRFKSGRITKRLQLSPRGSVSAVPKVPRPE